MVSSPAAARSSQRRRRAGAGRTRATCGTRPGSSGRSCAHRTRPSSLPAWIGDRARPNAARLIHSRPSPLLDPPPTRGPDAHCIHRYPPRPRGRATTAGSPSRPPRTSSPATGDASSAATAPTSGAAAALAHLGIEGDVDPVVLTALDKVRWRASVNPATSTPCPGVMDGQHHEASWSPLTRRTTVPSSRVYLDARAVRKAIKDTRREPPPSAPPRPPRQRRLVATAAVSAPRPSGRLLHVAAAHRVVRRLRPLWERASGSDATACAPTCSAARGDDVHPRSCVVARARHLARTVDVVLSTGRRSLPSHGGVLAEPWPVVAAVATHEDAVRLLEAPAHFASCAHGIEVGAAVGR